MYFSGLFFVHFHHPCLIYFNVCCFILQERTQSSNQSSPHNGIHTAIQSLCRVVSRYVSSVLWCHFYSVNLDVFSEADNTRSSIENKRELGNRCKLHRFECLDWGQAQEGGGGGEGGVSGTQTENKSWCKMKWRRGRRFKVCSSTCSQRSISRPFRRKNKVLIMMEDYWV